MYQSLITNRRVLFNQTSKTWIRASSPPNFDAGISTVSDARAKARSLWTVIRSGTDATVWATTIPIAISTSEGYSRTELNVAWIVAVLIHDPKRRVSRI